jgi:acetyl-CoA C-acetyltransferase
MRNVVIAGAARTPMGGFQGAFAGLTASALGGYAIKAALENAAPLSSRRS